jgi:poly [ADP-ribose] polymerase
VVLGKCIKKGITPAKTKTKNASAIAVHEKVITLIDYIFAEAGENISTYLKGGVAALNHLGQGQIVKGRQQLMTIKRLNDVYEKRSNPGNFLKLAEAVQSYFILIPTQLPPRPTPEIIVGNLVRSFYEQENRLDQLEAALGTMAVQVQDPSASKYESLGVRIERMSWHDKDHGKLVERINKTCLKRTHGFEAKVHDIFEVEIPHERKRFEDNKKGKSKVELLYHGTRGGNVRHILRSGLKIPVSAANGWMFGRGIYGANKFSKSAQYCLSSQGKPLEMLFLMDVALGKSYTAPGAMTSAISAPGGYDSVFGKASHTKNGMGSLLNDEFIVYDPAQVTLKYLVTYEKNR